MVTTGPWPSGPPWFLAVLLAFDAGGALLFAFFGRPEKERARLAAFTPGLCFSALLVSSLLAYLPLLNAFGPSRWLSLGPVAVQGSRIGLYAVYFGAGVVFGTKGLRSGTFPFPEGLARRWPVWTLLAVLMGAALIGTEWARGRDGMPLPGWVWLNVGGVALAAFCAAACFALPAILLRFGGSRGMPWGNLAASSYGIYLLHYPVVTWVQYGLLHMALGALAKAAVTFALALLVSCGGTILLRRLPGAARVA